MALKNNTPSNIVPLQGEIVEQKQIESRFASQMSPLTNAALRTETFFSNLSSI